MESLLYALYDKYTTALFFVPPVDYAQNLKAMYKKRSTSWSASQAIKQTGLFLIGQINTSIYVSIFVEIFKC